MRRPSSVGIDISDSSVKVLQLSPESTVVAYGSGPLPEGVVSQGFINDKTLFAQVLKEILKNTKPVALHSDQSMLRAVLCLPETQLFTHHTKLAKSIKIAEIADFVKEDSQKIVPFDLNDMYWDFHVSGSGENRYATFVGAPKKNVDNYVEALTFAEVKPSLIVGELFSLAVALTSAQSSKGNYAIVDIGAHNTNIGTFSGDAVTNLSVTVLIGGESLTSDLAKNLQVTKEEAESLKRKSGLSESSENALASEILKASLEEMLVSLKHVRSRFVEVTGQPIEYIVLAGGTALLPGLVDYFSTTLGLEVRVADPFVNVKNGESIKIDTPGIFFSNVIGLALQSVSEKTPAINLLTQYRYTDDFDKKETLSFRDIQSVADVKYIIYGYFDKTLDIIGSLFKEVHLRISFKLLSTAVLFILAVVFLVWVVARYT